MTYTAWLRTSTNYRQTTRCTQCTSHSTAVTNAVRNMCQRRPTNATAAALISVLQMRLAKALVWQTSLAA